MNMKKSVLPFVGLIAFAFLAVLIFGNIGSDGKVGMNIAIMKGPTSLGMVNLMQKNEDGKAKNDYNIEIVGTADEIVSKLAQGEIDLAAVPCNLASVLYNRTDGDIKVAAINTLGVLYALDRTGIISGIADLKGNTVYNTGKGTTPEYALNYILRQNGIVHTEINIEYRSEAAELAALLAAGEADIAILPEPFVSTVLSKNSDMKIAFSLTEEWNRVQPDFKMITGVLVVRSEYLEQNKAAFDKFLEEYKSSVQAINADVAAGAKLTDKYGLVAENIAIDAIPRCNVVYVDGEEMKADISGYLQVLFEADAKSVGGKLPGDDFYYLR